MKKVVIGILLFIVMVGLGVSKDFEKKRCYKKNNNSWVVTIK